jgi:hypothetical protein
MPAKIIYGVDFRAKTYKPAPTLEELAADIAAQMSGMIGEPVEHVMIYESSLGFVAPSDDCA